MNPAEYEALKTACEELTAACEAEFTAHCTEGLDENDEPFERDDSEVAQPSSHITFGMIRRARKALGAA